jgi:hypothetical protein
MPVIAFLDVIYVAHGKCGKLSQIHNQLKDDFKSVSVSPNISIRHNCSKADNHFEQKPTQFHSREIGFKSHKWFGYCDLPPILMLIYL